MSRFIANPGTGKVHAGDCRYAAASFEIEVFDMLHEAYSAGYVEAACCLTDRCIGTAKRARLIIKSVQTDAGVGCCVCGHARRVERAHIVPRHAGGSRTAPLCPNCHQAFDFGQMNEWELRQLSKYCGKNLGMTRRQVAECHGWGRAA